MKITVDISHFAYECFRKLADAEPEKWVTPEYCIASVLEGFVESQWPDQRPMRG